MNSVQIIKYIVASWRIYLVFLSSSVLTAAGFLVVVSPQYEVHVLYRTGSINGQRYVDGGWLARYLKSELFAAPLLKEVGISDPPEINQWLRRIQVRVIDERSLEILVAGNDISKVKEFLTLIAAQLVAKDSQFIEEQLQNNYRALQPANNATSTKDFATNSSTVQLLKELLFKPVTRYPEVFGPALVDSSTPKWPRPIPTLLLGVFFGLAVASVVVFLRRS